MVLVKVDIVVTPSECTNRRRSQRVSLATLLAVSIQDPLWIGANFSARLNLEEPLRVDCVVRRVEPAQGMGVSFVVRDAQDRARVAALLEVLAGK